MEGDKLVIALDNGRYALDTRAVAGIIELEKLPFLPGKSGFVAGVVSFRNEPVTVIDLKSALGDFTEAAEAGHKIIVLNSKGRLLGLDIGSSQVSFIWDNELKGRTTAEKGLLPGGAGRMRRNTPKKQDFRHRLCWRKSFFLHRGGP